MPSTETLPPVVKQLQRVLVIGGGASGIFTALRLGELAPHLEVTVLEGQSSPLGKVKLSGGGRCNVTHAIDEAKQWLNYYPRQHKQLRHLIHQFDGSAMRAWLARRGVPTHVEADGRVFPQTNESQSIIDAFLSTLRKQRGSLHLKASVTQLSFNEAQHHWQATLNDGRILSADAVVLATGSSSKGYALCEALGITLAPMAPSLFTFVVKDATLTALAGCSLPHVSVTIPAPSGKAKEAIRSEGPLLVTHWGVSGPAILKASAWGALALKACHYTTTVYVDTCPSLTHEAMRAWLSEQKQTHPKKQLSNVYLKEAGMPQRFWEYLLTRLGLPHEQRWVDTSEKALNQLTEHLKRLPLAIEGKGVFKEEFVTCGGIHLSEVDLKTLALKRQPPHLYAVGELLNVDGVTGGFNFQHCWASANQVALTLAEGLRKK
jgi:predicted Rossmann fold flavoprotein